MEGSEGLSGKVAFRLTLEWQEMPSDDHRAECCRGRHRESKGRG